MYAQKFHLKPKPEVKTLPGTKMYSFSPSSTHEQPPDNSMPIPKVVKSSEEATAAKADFFDKPAEVSDSEMSTSPKAFLKAMAKGVKGNQPKQREERGGSLIDNFLRRGRSTSKDQGGSRSSSRQGSVEKGRDGESSSSYVSAGSGENFDPIGDVSYLLLHKAYTLSFEMEKRSFAAPQHNHCWL